MEKKIPVKEGEEYDVEIVSVGGQGDGVAKIEGLTIFVPGASRGDKVRIRIKKLLKTYAFAEVI